MTVTAHDDDGDPLSYTYQWVRDGTDIAGQTGATLDLSVAGNGDKGDQIAVRVTASDGTDPSVPVTSGAVGVVNSAPTFDQDLGDRTDPEGFSVGLSAGATDPDGDPLTYGATGLPPGLSIDVATGQITGTIDAGAAGASPYATQVTVQDGATVDATDGFS